MDPPPPPLIPTLSQHELSSSSSSGQLNTWLQKPISKLTCKSITPLSPFNHPFAGCSSPSIYDEYSKPRDSTLEQGFTGGDPPLLTSSWEVLDKLVSASMTSSPSAKLTTQMYDLAASMKALQAASSSSTPSLRSLSDADQKPLSAFYGSLHHAAWSTNQLDNASIGTIAASNVGLNLASLISEDPGFVDRAAKFSSYSSQQINCQAYNSSLLQPNRNSYINATSEAHDYNIVDGSCGGKNLMNNNVNAANHVLSRTASSNVSQMEQHINAKSNVGAPINDSNVNNSDKHSRPPQTSMVNLSGSKKKRGAMKVGEDDDSGGNVGRKKAKKGELEHQAASNGKGPKSKASGNEKPKQYGVLDSRESPQKSEVCNDTNKTPSPPPKSDFIHVRARRGQATDSHSLAERVRREKISERMKYLQDLVPGCTKVTGKATMLDEIINYVQSLQGQVEFLSMKLAAVPPSKLEFNFESALFGKEALQQPTLQSDCNARLPTGPLLETSTPLPLNSSSFLPLDNLQSLQHNMAFLESMNTSSVLHSLVGPDPSLRQTPSMLAAAPSDNFGDCISQISDAWVDDDLQNIVPRLPRFSQSPLNMHHSFQGAMLNSLMKTEL